MKQTYKTIRAFIVLLSLIAMKAGAQALSGVYTINGAALTGGTNYQTFTAFANAINTNGVAGPVTVNVVPGSGPYNEQPVFMNIAGATSINKITINGNGNLLTANGSASIPFTLLLNGTKYMSINNLQMSGTNISYAMVCTLMNNADYNMFTACTFSAPANSTAAQTVPFCFSTSSLSPTNGGTPGNFNTVTTCTMSSGYYSIYHYGNSAAPYMTDNAFIGCYITDFYYSCIYGYYAKNMTIKNCTIDRLTRTTLTTTYVVYGWYMQGLMFDGNLIHKLYDAAQSNTGTLYGFYYVGYYNTGLGTNRNTIRNNIIKDINFAGAVYFFNYNYLSDNDYIHNTISFDQTSATTSSALYVFYYCYGGVYTGVNAYNTFKNNIISITRGGSGTKYAMYFGGNTTGVISDYNDIYVNSAGGGNNIGYFSANAPTWANWQSQGQDANGQNVNPMFTNVATGDLHPTNPAINNMATPLGVQFDQTNMARNLSTPDFGALEFLTPNCSGTPSLTAVLSPTYPVCPGNIVNLGLSYYQPAAGITYQWQYSTSSSVGPWTVVPTATDVAYTTPGINSNVYWGVVVSCATGGTITPAGYITVAGTTTNTAPYYEGFEGLGYNGMLPNCSWATNSGNAQTYTAATTGNRVPATGNKFAAFAPSASGNASFYTNGVLLNAGVTYSASMWYNTDYAGNTNFTNLSMLIGPNQSTTGAVVVATTGGPAIAAGYKSLSNIFTVPSTGIYYMAIKATSNAGSNYLSFDDVRIDIPCSLNSPTVAITGPTVACSGQAINFSASGANSYTWNTGANTQAVTVIPGLNTTGYTVMGKNNTTGCITTITKPLTVNQTPLIFVTGNPDVCEGGTSLLTAVGAASSYTWSSTGLPGANTTIAPTANTTYTVLGTANNCIGSATVAVTVKALPPVGATSSKPNGLICLGETVSFTGSGATTYSWSSTSGYIVGSPVNITPLTTGAVNYVVTGYDLTSGCTNTAVISANVLGCVGINKLSGSSAISVYPNPNTGVFSVELNNTSVKTVAVMDLTGRVLVSSTTSDEVVTFDISTLANGIYYVKVQSADKTDVIKVVKN